MIPEIAETAASLTQQHRSLCWFSGVVFLRAYWCCLLACEVERDQARINKQQGTKMMVLVEIYAADSLQSSCKQLLAA